MKEFTTPLGKALKIEEASFEDACELNSLICKELLDSDISLSLVIREIALHFEGKKELREITFSDLLTIPAVLEIFSRVFLSLISSAAVRDKIFKCLEKSLYDQERILKERFENPETRKDFFFIVKKCLEINILCFIPTLS